MVSGSLTLLYFLLGFHGGRQGRFSVRLSVRPSVCPSVRPSGWLAGWLGLRPSWLGLRPGWLGLRPGWMAQGGGTDGRTNGRTENLPILQDFVPYRGRCPASPMKTKEKVEQGKGTADHLMPLGYLLYFVRKYRALSSMFFSSNLLLNALVMKLLSPGSACKFQ